MLRIFARAGLKVRLRLICKTKNSEHTIPVLILHSDHTVPLLIDHSNIEEKENKKSNKTLKINKFLVVVKKSWKSTFWAKAEAGKEIPEPLKTDRLRNTAPTPSALG